MTEIVHEHNELNGYRFTIAEFGGMGLVLTALVAHYAAVGRFLDAGAWFGLVVNSAAVALLALATLRDRAIDPGMLPCAARASARPSCRATRGSVATRPCWSWFGVCRTSLRPSC